MGDGAQQCARLESEHRRGVAASCRSGEGRSPSPENKPINGFEGPLPFAEVQEAEPPDVGLGRSPALLHRFDVVRKSGLSCVTHQETIMAGTPTFATPPGFPRPRAR